ncbi:MAG TPA: tRNA-dihydrouridine synthase [Verrucomicrobiae bacterium]|nr:tRNA-dihydrouridine synthase [Verrucomicrobiae bacterium]
METGFWQSLPRPIFGLSPMDGVTDAAYRFVVAKYGKPHIIMTEFTAAEGIRAGAERLLVDFLYDPIERPIAAQLFGSDPDAFRIASAVSAALGFDGIDINMGCPAKNIADRGAGASLILDPPRAKAIIRSTREGIRQWAEGASLLEIGVPENIAQAVEVRRASLGLSSGDRRILPVSVKTRVGVTDIVIEEWVRHLLEEEPAAITIHGRTLKQLYTGLADWDAIARAAAIIHTTDTLALGNGDVQSLEDAEERVKQYGVDGILVGRATYGNPWLFTGYEASFEEKMAVALEHAHYLDKVMEGKAFIRMRKHLMDYTKGFEGARELRQRLMKITTLTEVEEILLH